MLENRKKSHLPFSLSFIILCLLLSNEMTSSIGSLSEKMTEVEQAQPTMPPQKDFGDDDEQVPNEQQEDVEARVPTETKCGDQGEIVRENGLNFWMVLFNFFKGLVGAGFLGLPMAFSDAHPLYALILLFAIAIISFFAMINLVKCAQYHYARLNIPFINFGDLAEESCKVSFGWAKDHGKKAKNIVNAITVVHQIGICSMYYLFIANTFEKLWNPEQELSGNILWFLIIFPPLVFLNTVVTMRILSIMSLVGNGLMLLSVSLILFILFANVAKGEDAGAIGLSDINYGLEISSLFRACGTIIVSCLAQSLVLPLENKIKKPRQMLGPFGILSCGIGLSTILYACVGFFGYLAFGNNQDGSIIDYLDCDEGWRTLFYVIRLSLCLSIFSSFMLQMFVVVGVFLPSIEYRLKNSSRPMQWSCTLLFRSILVFFCLLLSYFVENLGLIIRLIGVTTGTLLAFVFPAMFDLFTFVPLLQQSRVHQANMKLVKTILMACFGLVILVGGLSTNIATMVNGSSKHKCTNTTMMTESFTTVPVS